MWPAGACSWHHDFPAVKDCPNRSFFPYFAFVGFFVPQMRKVTNSLECSFLGECLTGLVYHRSGMLCSYIWQARVAGRLTASIWRQWGLRKCRPHDSRLIQRNDLPSVMCWSDSTLCREWLVVSRDPSLHPLWLNVRPKGVELFDHAWTTCTSQIYFFVWNILEKVGRNLPIKGKMLYDPRVYWSLLKEGSQEGVSAPFFLVQVVKCWLGFSALSTL